MFFFFVCGEHTFRKEVPGYEGMVCQCHHCGNMAANVIKSNPWFTFCWIVRTRAAALPVAKVKVKKCIANEDNPLSL